MAVRASVDSGTTAPSYAISATSFPVNLPTGLTVGDPIFIPVQLFNSIANGGGTVAAPTNWSFKLAQTTDGSAAAFILQRDGTGGDGLFGWQPGDVSPLTISFSSAPTAATRYAYTSTALIGGSGAAFGTLASFVQTVSSTTQAAPSAGTSAQEIYTIFLLKVNTLTSISVSPNAGLVDSALTLTGGTQPAPGVWVGVYGPSVTPAVQTATLGGATANCIAVQLPYTLPAAGGAPQVIVSPALAAVQASNF